MYIFSFSVSRILPQKRILRTQVLGPRAVQPRRLELAGRRRLRRRKPSVGPTRFHQIRHNGEQLYRVDQPRDSIPCSWVI